MIKIVLCTEGLSNEDREAILASLYDELHISPGQVSADGNFELEIGDCGEDPQDGAPYLRVDGALFARVTPQRAADLVRARKRH